MYKDIENPDGLLSKGKILLSMIFSVIFIVLLLSPIINLLYVSIDFFSFEMGIFRGIFVLFLIIGLVLNIKYFIPNQEKILFLALSVPAIVYFIFYITDDLANGKIFGTVGLVISLIIGVFVALIILKDWENFRNKEEQIFNIKEALNIDEDMSNEEVNIVLKEEFKKWNQRIGHSDIEIQKQAEFMLDAIAEIKQEYSKN